MVDSSESQPHNAPAAAGKSTKTTAQSGRPAVAAAAPRGKRGRRSLWLVLAAGILWVVGQGVGWFGAGPSGEKGEGDGVARGDSPGNVVGSGLPSDRGANGGTMRVGAPDPEAADPEAADPEGPNPDTRSPATADPNAAVAEGTVSTVQGTPVSVGTEDGAKASPSAAATGNPGKGDPAVAGEPSPDVGIGVAEDRFASLMSLLESHLAEQQLGDASAALQRLLQQPLSHAQRLQLAGVQERLLPLTKAREQRVLELVQRGEVLAADREASQLVVGGVWRASELLAAAPELLLASNWQNQIVSSGKVPMPVPLLRNRKVRVRWRDELRAGVVAGSSRDEVTVRLVSEGGQTFPTVKAIACEPFDSSSSEAVEMGLAAVRAGAPRLARLWMLRAHLLKDELTTRGQQLLELLR